MAERCQFWLPKKKRFCANLPFKESSFCGNHSPRVGGTWVPCRVDPSHLVLKENLEGHMKKCPQLKQAQSLSDQPYYQKGINCVSDDGGEGSRDTVFSSEMKRNAVYSMKMVELIQLLRKIRNIHELICNEFRDSYKLSEACDIWVNKEIDGKLPYKEKHVLQQASILGNMEDFGLMKKISTVAPGEGNEISEGDENKKYGVSAVVEFGAGRGYLTQVLADCYGIDKVFLVERRSYKLKADRSLRQKESLVLERLRIDIEDLNLSAIKSLKGIPYLAIGKHLCGPATDLMLRCCVGAHNNVQHSGEGHSSSNHLRGLAIAPCCHHLCQWKHYINKPYLLKLQISEEMFHAMTWFTSWAVDADHASDFTDINLRIAELPAVEALLEGSIDMSSSLEETLKKMKPAERAVIGFMCKDIIDMGRFMWVKERGLTSEIVNYVPLTISPENHLIVGRW